MIDHMFKNQKNAGLKKNNPETCHVWNMHQNESVQATTFRYNGNPTKSVPKHIWHHPTG